MVDMVAMVVIETTMEMDMEWVMEWTMVWAIDNLIRIIEDRIELVIHT